MEPNKIIKRLHDIEQEVVSLKSEMAPRRTWGKVFGKTGMFLVSYWALMSFFAAIATATYVKFAFNIDYFESYRNASAIKRLSEFHRQMGDEMFLRSNWKQALASYKAATTANPANTAAALGEVKSGVFLPDSGQKLIDPGISKAKIHRLLELYPDDPQVAYLDVIQAFQDGRLDEVIPKCDVVLSRHKTFAGGYLLKAYVQQSRAELKEAIATLESLLVFDPNNGQAHSNLGYCQLLLGRTEDAMKHLELGLTHYPTMVNAISLAEACRMGGKLDRASSLISTTERLFNTPGTEEEYFASGEWLWNHLPEKDGDAESAQNTIRCFSLDQKRAILRISQGLLAATNGDGKGALEHFVTALKLEPSYKPFLINKLRATVFAGVADKAVKQAMKEYADSLETETSGR